MTTEKPRFAIKEPKKLSTRIKWLRDYYFEGVKRKWNAEYTSWTTGTPWDFQYNELSFYIVPETYFYIPTFRSSFKQTAKPVKLDADFWKWSLPERRAWFLKEVMVKYLPKEILPGDLLAGARFNVMISHCLTEKETKEYDKLVKGKGGAREAMLWFHNHGYGNCGATSGHLVPGYARVLEHGWKGIHADLQAAYAALSDAEKKGKQGGQLRAMITASTLARDLASEYRKVLTGLAAEEKDEQRKAELTQMAENLSRVPWEPARNFWEAVQSLWMTHMLVMSDENYPGPGVSFGRIDQYLYPLWQSSLKAGMEREFAKEILMCFWVHCNTAYDAMIRNGYQGITSGFGQLVTLSGLGKDGRDMTNDLTFAILEVIDEMSPILEPKPNIRLHRDSPDDLLDRVVDMVGSSQGAPFLLNFDERSMAGMIREGRLAGLEHLINESNVHDYAPVGCLENTMVGNDRSGTVDCNLNLLKAVELAVNNGRDLLSFTDPITGKTEKIGQDGPATGDAAGFASWEEFWNAYRIQTAALIQRCVDLYETTEAIRAKFFATPYLSCLVKGCAEKGLDITRGGAQISFVTMEAVTFATTVDSLLAIQYLVFETKKCTMAELVKALRANWEGYEMLQTLAKNRAPKYGRDDDRADAMAREVMALWCDETWKHKTRITGRQFRPGMLSWNYWAGDGFVMAASPDGRRKGQFLSNAICPSNGADINGPTANTNSVGNALGGMSPDGKGDLNGYVNMLPNGASHTISFQPAMVRDPAHREKFKAFLKAYARNGGTALQINMVDPDMLRDAQKHPEDYRHLLVRVTGYNAYFTAVGRELQNEIIERVSHERL
jgi:formate C-acetyltransferase